MTQKLIWCQVNRLTFCAAFFRKWNRSLKITKETPNVYDCLSRVLFVRILDQKLILDICLVLKVSEAWDSISIFRDPHTRLSVWLMCFGGWTSNYIGSSYSPFYSAPRFRQGQQGLFSFLHGWIDAGFFSKRPQSQKLPTKKIQVNFT